MVKLTILVHSSIWLGVFKILIITPQKLYENQKYDTPWVNNPWFCKKQESESMGPNQLRGQKLMQKNHFYLCDCMPLNYLLASPKSPFRLNLAIISQLSSLRMKFHSIFSKRYTGLVNEYMTVSRPMFASNDVSDNLMARPWQ